MKALYCKLGRYTLMSRTSVEVPDARVANQSETKSLISYFGHGMGMGTHEMKMNIIPSRPYTLYCSARFIVNITRQHDNDSCKYHTPT